MDALIAAAGADLPPAIPALRRQLLLARAGRPRCGRGTAHHAGAGGAARRRARPRCSTRCTPSGSTWQRLDRLVPDELAQHWQITLDFLGRSPRAGRRCSPSEGCIDPADRRNRLLAAQARAWRAAPPPAPVIAAGSTGSIPATAELLAVIARLPQGAVVLPGLDRRRTRRPGAHRRRAGRSGLRRRPVASAVRPGACCCAGWASSARRVRPWPAPGVAGTRRRGRRIASRALAPGRQRRARLRRSRRLRRPRSTASTRSKRRARRRRPASIALIMRETLEDPDRTAALVTPDRALAPPRRGRAAALGHRRRRFRRPAAGADAARRLPAPGRPDDAAEASRRCRCWRRSSIRWPPAGRRPRRSAPRSARSNAARCAARGRRPASPACAGAGGGAQRGRPRRSEARRWLDRAGGERSAPLDRLVDHGAVQPRPSCWRRMWRRPRRWRQPTTESGAARLWAGDAGEALAGFVADLARGAPTAIRRSRSADYPALLDVLMAGRVVRPRCGRHPRLAIWGPLEARLQRADVMILGGLNEGTWPPQAHAEPVDEPADVQAFGLPLPERRIGLSAHDFCQAFAAPEVVADPRRARRRARRPCRPAGCCGSRRCCRQRLDRASAPARRADRCAGSGCWIAPGADRAAAAAGARRRRWRRGRASCR